MKRSTLGWILGGILIIGLIVIIILLINNPNLTGEVTKNEIILLNTTTYTTNYGNSGSGNNKNIILDENQYLEAGRYYTRGFIVSENSIISVSLDSDNPIHYVLLPESQVNRYKEGKSFNSYGVRTRVMFLENSYELEPGSYSIVLTSLNKPVNIHLIIKEREESIE